MLESHHVHDVCLVPGAPAVTSAASSDLPGPALSEPAGLSLGSSRVHMPPGWEGIPEPGASCMAAAGGQACLACCSEGWQHCTRVPGAVSCQARVLCSALTEARYLFLQRKTIELLLCRLWGCLWWLFCPLLGLLY